jgi:mono/diheme cytochrome c family protein
MKRFLAGVVVTLVALGLGALAFMGLGIIDVTANAEPGLLERQGAGMALDMAMDRHDSHRPNPFTPDDATLVQGARVYEAKCASCHGGAENPVGPLGLKLSPRAPQFTHGGPDDPDSRLFWLVQNGIRWTGMPGWQGILSDDDIWKVVLFVKHTDTLSPAVQAEWKKAADKPSIPVK